MGLHVNMTGPKIKAKEPYTYIRGAAFSEGNNSKPESLLDYFSGTKTKEDFQKLVTSLNGFFAVVCRHDHMLFAAVDRARSIPLFYGCRGSEFYISDDANWVQAKVGRFERCKLAEKEFCMTGYVTGSDTLYPGVKQLRAGELLIATDMGNRVEYAVERYYDFINTEGYYEASIEELSERFDKVLIGCFERLIALADGRTIVIPLSGGWDSRLIALMLVRLGYKNVVAFTYGRPGNLESEISKKVAETLGIEWHFVPYTNELKLQWFLTDERRSYHSFAHNLVSLPHSQDWPAVWELKKNGLIPNDSVFVPGHTGDFISGGHIPIAFIRMQKVSRQRLIHEIFSKHYSLLSIQKDLCNEFHEILKGRINSCFIPSKSFNIDDAARLYENWDWQERQAKFIVNSVRVYEYWGYDWWLPLWDFKMIKFWEKVALEHRFMQRLYKSYLKALFIKIADDADTKDLIKTNHDAMFNYIKKVIKRTPLRSLIKLAGHKIKKEIEYETAPLASYGVMSKETFLKYYDKGYKGINAYMAAYTIGLINLP